jgi:hypothetical protein
MPFLKIKQCNCKAEVSNRRGAKDAKKQTKKEVRRQKSGVRITWLVSLPAGRLASVKKHATRHPVLQLS